MSSPIFVLPHRRSASAERSSNLPLQPTSFIGREQERALARKMVLQDGARLLTLSGPPGIGKTRLALEIAADLEDYFKDSVWFVSLASITDPTLVVSAIAHTLGLKESSGRPLLDILKDYLRSKQMLLLLDNFEQVIEAAPIVADLLSTAPEIKLLVTSRESLRLRGEREFQVLSLSRPNPRRLPSVEQLLDYEAIALFAQRASEIRADFIISKENASSIAEICARLDGLPLAIELAAARIKLLPPQAMVARLSERLQFLTGGQRDLPARHQTLRSAVEWSYDLLNEEEKLLFRKLGVFAGGCMLDAAEAVCNEEGKSKATFLNDLESLVDKSLLNQGETSGEPRFTMLETIREYALEKLEENGEGGSIKRRCADFYLQMVEQAEPELTGSSRQVEWLQRLEEEHSNLRSVLAWSLERGEVEIALRLAGALWRFWWMRGHLSDGRKWLQTALDSAGDAHPALRAKALCGVGSLAWTQGDFDRAEERTAESVRLYREVGDRYGEAHAFITLGIVYTMRGQYTEGERVHREGLDICRELADQFGIMRATHNLGVLARYRGDYPRAQALFEEALALAREQGYKHIMGLALDHLGHAMLGVGNHRGADRVLKEGMLLFGELGDKRLLSQCLLGLAGVAAMEGRPETSAQLFGAAEALREAVGVEMDHADRAEYDRYLSVARPQVSQVVFDLAWKYGRALSIEEALATAQTVAIPSEETDPTPFTDRSTGEESGGLTQREREVAALIAQSKSNSEIAESLVITKRTVETHIGNILSKLGFTSRGQIAAWALQRDLASKS